MISYIIPYQELGTGKEHITIYPNITVSKTNVLRRLKDAK